MSEATLMCWGANSYGQLCTGDTEDRLEPTKSQMAADNIVQICGGGGHTLFLLRHGAVVACGSNARGQIGEADSSSSGPVSVSLPEAARQLVAGWETSFVLTDSGRVFAWGSNSHGQLGIGSDQASIASPTAVPCEKIVDLAAGSRHALSVTESGHVLTWGWNKKGQLGVVGAGCNRPQRIPEVEGAKRCASGDHHSVVLLSDGSILLWGDNRYGQCGEANGEPSCPRPVRLEIPSTSISRIFCGWTHTSLLMNDGVVLTWGRNTYHQLGRTVLDSTFSCRPTPVDGLRVTSMSCGSQHTLAVTDEPPSVVAWGWNEHGICGVPDEVDVPLPRTVELPSGFRPVLVGCGAGTSFALMHKIV